MLIKLSQFTTLTVLAVFLVTVFQNCGSTESSSGSITFIDSSVNHQEIEQRYKALENLAAADLRCADVSDCTAIPVGHRGCGGPNGYLVTSVLNGNFDQIDVLATELTELERDFNIQHEVVSTCDYWMPPDLVCASSICKQQTVISGI